MAEPASFLIALLVNFFLYMIVIFFPDAPNQTAAITKDVMLSDSPSSSSALLYDQWQEPFRTTYWKGLEGDATKNSKTFANINEVVAFDSNRGIFAIAQDGEIRVLRIVNSSAGCEIVNKMKVRMPSDVGRRGGIWHASFDAPTGRLYFTITEKHGTGVFYTDDNMMDRIAKNSSEEVTLTAFVKSSTKRDLRGICIDTTRRLLFVAETHTYGQGDGAILIYSLKDGGFSWPLSKLSGQDKKPDIQAVARLQSNESFRPWDCSVYGDYLAASDHSKHSIYLFKLTKNETTQECNQPVFVREIASKGNESGSVYDPWGVNFDPAGNLLVADRGNKRIQLFHAPESNPLDLKPVWQSDPVTYHIKSATTTLENTESSANPHQAKVRIVASMYPSQLLLF